MQRVKRACEGSRKAVPRPAGLITTMLAAWLLVPGFAGGSTASVPQEWPGGTILVYLIDHQFLTPDELATLQGEINEIFEDADIGVQWIADDSPRRALYPNELRVIVLPSDGTRWFHGPSNVIGLAPHDDRGIGRNCWVFYRQALWFRQQAILRCREATRARAEAQARGEEPDSSINALAPPECGKYLRSLTPMIVARAAAHEMVHILLNKLDHAPRGLMRDSFNITEWLVDDRSPFRLGDDEVGELQALNLDEVAPAISSAPGSR